MRSKFFCLNRRKFLRLPGSPSTALDLKRTGGDPLASGGLSIDIAPVGQCLCVDEVEAAVCFEKANQINPFQYFWQAG